MKPRSQIFSERGKEWPDDLNTIPVELLEQTGFYMDNIQTTFHLSGHSGRNSR
jgi:hypothetical protein